MKKAPGCSHQMFDWDCHQFCVSCRDNHKGTDVCATEPDGCYVCLQFTSDQKKKINKQFRKLVITTTKKSHKDTKKDEEQQSSTPITKELEDQLLGEESVKTSKSPGVQQSVQKEMDPLAQILAKLEHMQGRIIQLETRKSDNVTHFDLPVTDQSQGDILTEQRNDQVSDTRGNDHVANSSSSKRARSPSPGEIESDTNKDDENTDEDPSYRQTLGAIRMLLDLEVPEDVSTVSSRIFGLKHREAKKRSVPPMVMPTSQEVVNRWTELEKKAAGTPKDDDPDILQSTPYNVETFLPYKRPNLKFYKTTSTEFAVTAPRVQDTFKSFSKRSSYPSMVHIPMRQHLLMETVKREHVQVLSYVNYFVQGIEKAAMTLENALQVSQAVFKGSDFWQEYETMLNHLQIQFSCVQSLVMALETMVDSSITMACNLELARRDSMLKYCCHHLRDHEINKLRRTGFKSGDLFCPAALNSLDKRYEKSPKRQKTQQQQPIFQSRRYTEFSQRKSNFRASQSQSGSQNSRRSFPDANSANFTSAPGRGRGSKRR